MSTILLEKRLLASSLLPTELQEKFDELGKKEMCAIALLITNTALNAIKAFEQGLYKKFDANPGDGGCQMRALELRQLMKRGLTRKLCSGLEEECCSLKIETSRIKDFILKKQPYEGCVFGSEKIIEQALFEELKVSKEMEYLLHCYLSTVLRTPYRIQENGVIMTKSDMSKLSILSKNIGVLSSEFRNKIVEENQEHLSILSLEALRASARRATSLKDKEKELMLTMLSKEHVRLFTPDEKYKPKAFGCVFYEVKAVLTHLREEQGIICLKSITKEKKPFYIFLQSKEAGGEFEVLLDEECTSLDPAMLIVVFEAVMHMGKEELIKRLKQHGFTNMVFIQAAKQPPYEPGSSINDIKNPEAIREIRSYLAQGAEIENFFTMDHVYLNDLGKELGLKQGPKKDKL